MLAPAYTRPKSRTKSRIILVDPGPRACVVHPAGIEPATSGLGNRCSILLSYGCVTRCHAEKALQSQGETIARNFEIVPRSCENHA